MIGFLHERGSIRVKTFFQFEPEEIAQNLQLSAPNCKIYPALVAEHALCLQPSHTIRTTTWSKSITPAVHAMGRIGITVFVPLGLVSNLIGDERVISAQS